MTRGELGCVYTVLLVTFSTGLVLLVTGRPEWVNALGFMLMFVALGLTFLFIVSQLWHMAVQRLRAKRRAKWNTRMGRD